MFSVLPLPQKAKNTKTSHRRHHLLNLRYHAYSLDSVLSKRSHSNSNSERWSWCVLLKNFSNSRMFCFSLALSQNLITFTKCLSKTIGSTIWFCSVLLLLKIETDAYMRSQSLDFENSNPTHDRLSLRMPNHSFHVLCFASFSDTGTESSKFGLCYSLELFK